MTGEQRAFRNVLIGAANRAVHANRLYEDTHLDETTMQLWYGRAFDAAASKTVFALLADIDRNWDHLIRTYEGPGT